MKDWLREMKVPIVLCCIAVATVALLIFWHDIKAAIHSFTAPSKTRKSVVAAVPKEAAEQPPTVHAAKQATKKDIPWEQILTVADSHRVKAKDPRCGNWRLWESYIHVPCIEDPEADPEDPKTIIYHLKVIMDRRHKDIKDYFEFSQMAKNLAPGVKVRIEAEPKRIPTRLLEPGMSPPKRYRTPVYTEKSGDMNLIVVKHTRLSILEID